MTKLAPIFAALIIAGLGVAKGAAGWDGWKVHQQASELLDKGDFAGLEALAATLKQEGYDIRQRDPELGGFYGGLRLGDDAPLDEWQKRLGVIGQWRALYPDSLTARLAEIHWYMDYPAGIYMPPEETGTGMPPPNAEMTLTVPKPPVNCMAKAISLLKEVPAAKVDDPEYYLDWLKICELQGRPHGEMWDYFKKGKAIAPHYAPLYEEVAIYLTPDSYGKDLERVNWEKQAANGFPGLKGDGLYGNLLREEAYHYGVDFFQLPVDYGRAKRGLLAMMGINTLVRWKVESSLAWLACVKGDKPTARRMLLELEGEKMDDWWDAKLYTKYMAWSGAEAALDTANGLEKAGKLADAEKMLLSFTTDPGIYIPLEYFYERQGMKDKLLGMQITIVGKTVKEMSEMDPGYAPADVLGELASYYALMGEWDKAEIAARRFEQLRPMNMIGRIVLLLCALKHQDAELAVRTVMDIIQMHTNYKPYKKAQLVLSGQRQWNPKMRGAFIHDIYNGQGATAIALFYMAKGENDLAKKVLNDVLPYCAENSGKAVMQSLLYGSLSRSLTPVALLPGGAMPATTGTAGNGAAVTGTNQGGAQ